MPLISEGFINRPQEKPVIRVNRMEPVVAEAVAEVPKVASLQLCSRPFQHSVQARTMRIPRTILPELAVVVAEAEKEARTAQADLVAKVAEASSAFSLSIMEPTGLFKIADTSWDMEDKVDKAEMAELVDSVVLEDLEVI